MVRDVGMEEAAGAPAQRAAVSRFGAKQVAARRCGLDLLFEQHGHHRSRR
jgi:hypothetical protein